MQHLFVPYELALLAKEKGFYERCLALYIRGNNLYAALTGDREIGKEGFGSMYNNMDNEDIAAPLYQQLVDWFRKKGIIIECPADHTSDLKYVIEIHKYLSIKEMKLPKNSEMETRFKKIIVPPEFYGYYRNYYKCMEIALTEAFKLI